jgi:hypothetical protein
LLDRSHAIEDIGSHKIGDLLFHFEQWGAR